MTIRCKQILFNVTKRNLHFERFPINSFFHPHYPQNSAHIPTAATPADDKMHSAILGRPEKYVLNKFRSYLTIYFIFFRAKKQQEKCFMIMKILALWDQNVFRSRIFYNNAFCSCLVLSEIVGTGWMFCIFQWSSHTHELWNWYSQHQNISFSPKYRALCKLNPFGTIKNCPILQCLKSSIKNPF